MPSIKVQNISKKFASIVAVENVSFDVEPGEIFGLLGPNGAGKTTTIRIILDIFKPDSGSIEILGSPMTEEKKNQIGYLPEERGLYQDMQLERCLVYLATLKGLESSIALERINKYLDRFDLKDWRKKKVKELSKGMQQKAQLITTLVHQPQIIIIDEPFSALDPINTQMVKDLLREERNNGKTIIMCTHQMHQVEELCDRLVLIDHGKAMLYGSLHDVRQQFAKPAVAVISPDPLPAAIPGVDGMQQENGGFTLHLLPGVSPQEILKNLLKANIRVEKFEIAMPTLDEIFIEVVKNRGVSQ
ncbi:MAG: ABC transporter ATP-binding protein [Anaerolineaceae bacterium]